jgi:hypothetical protein
MNKAIIGFVVGGAVTAAVLVPIIKYEQHEKYNYGRHIGRIDGQLEVFHFLEKHFAKQGDEQVPSVEWFSVKGQMIYIVKQDEAVTVVTE